MWWWAGGRKGVDWCYMDRTYVGQAATENLDAGSVHFSDRPAKREGSAMSLKTLHSALPTVKYFSGSFTWRLARLPLLWPSPAWLVIFRIPALEIAHRLSFFVSTFMSRNQDLPTKA